MELNNEVKESLTKIKKKPQAVKRMQKALKFVRKRWILLVALITSIVFISLAAYFYLGLERTGSLESYDKVEVTNNFPEALEAGVNNDFVINIKNKHSVGLKNVKVDIKYSPEFKFNKSLQGEITQEDESGLSYFFKDLEANSSESVVFAASLVNNIGQQSKIDYTVEYIPEPLYNDGNPLILNFSETIRIRAPQILASIEESSETVERGNNFEIKFNFDNNSKNKFENLSLTPAIPSEDDIKIEFEELVINNGAETVRSKDKDSYKIDSIDPNSENSLVLRGVVGDKSASELDFNFVLTIASEDSVETELVNITKRIKVVPKALSVTTSITGKDNNLVFNEEEKLSFTVQIQNKSDKPIKNLVITASVDDPAQVLNWSEASTDKTSGDIERDKIVFKPNSFSDLESLEPNKSVEVNYTIPVKKKIDYLKSSTGSDKYTLTPFVEVEAEQRETIISASNSVYRAVSVAAFTQSIDGVDDIDIAVEPEPVVYEDSDEDSDLDTDDDGILDVDDDDIDDDGDLNEDDDDVDGDGELNVDDDDIDGDGTLNEVDSDMDGDGVVNEEDGDADANGVLDEEEEEVVSTKPGRVYYLKWSIKTEQNPLTNVRITTSLPSPNIFDIDLVDDKIKSLFEYDEDKRTLILKVGDSQGYQGLDKPVQEFIVPVIIESNSGNFEDIIVTKQAVFEATDSITGQSLKFDQESVIAEE